VSDRDPLGRRKTGGKKKKPEKGEMRKDHQNKNPNANSFRGRPREKSREIEENII